MSLLSAAELWDSPPPLISQTTTKSSSLKNAPIWEKNSRDATPVLCMPASIMSQHPLRRDFVFWATRCSTNSALNTASPALGSENSSSPHQNSRFPTFYRFTAAQRKSAPAASISSPHTNSSPQNPTSAANWLSISPQQALLTPQRSPKNSHPSHAIATPQSSPPQPSPDSTNTQKASSLKFTIPKTAQNRFSQKRW